MGLGAQSVQSAQPLLPCSPSTGPRFTGIVSPPRARRGCTASSLGARRAGDRSGCARDSSSLLAPASRSFSSSVLWFFGPSLQLHCQPSSLLRPRRTPPPLSRRRSPQLRSAKVQNLSPRAAWLYTMRLDDLWASLFSASLPPAPGLAASLCSYGRGFASRFFQFRLAATPCGFATVAVIGFGWLLSSNKILPMLGTRRSRLSRRR